MENKKYKKVSFPKFVVGNLPLLRLLVKEEKQPYFIQKVEDPRQKPSGMTPNFMSGSRLTYNGNDAFTLIELLVVVLIIGLLAAVALPQYQKAVEKSKATQAITLLKSTAQAIEVYYLANGSWPNSFDDLSIDIPWTGTTAWRSTDVVPLTRSNTDWSLQFLHDGNSFDLYVGRVSGPYAGAGFGIFFTSLKKGNIYCLERSHYGISFQKNPGDYCQKIFKGELSYTGSYRAYSLP